MLSLLTVTVALLLPLLAVTVTDDLPSSTVSLLSTLMVVDVRCESAVQLRRSLEEIVAQPSFAIYCSMTVTTVWQAPRLSGVHCVDKAESKD